MQDYMVNGQLPDFESPPVVETVLGVQFKPLSGFKNAHLGGFWKTLDLDEWSSVTDAPPLQPQFERFTESATWAKGIQFQLTQDPASRLQIRNGAGDRMIQVQNGRLHFNWLGKEGSDYPRYEKVREGFVGLFQRFIEFLAEEDIADFQPNQWEVTYVNHIPKGTVWRVPGDWAFFSRSVLSIPLKTSCTARVLPANGTLSFPTNADDFMCSGSMGSKSPQAKKSRSPFA